MRNVPVGGYVLAGGRSSRMGTDKALLEIGGKTLIERAVAKLRGFCADVHILSSNSALASYAPLVADIHPGCGPIGGMEAALDHSPHAWNVFLSVDMPLLPAVFMRTWVSDRIREGVAARICLFEVDGRPQPGFCLLHKDVLRFLTESILGGEYKLMRAFEQAGRKVAIEKNVAQDKVLLRHAIEAGDASSTNLSAAWFTNLNVPEDVAEAEKHIDALDS
jgi:molybdopterin-guanine dinucleotide biosynthesis protein A